MVGTVKIIAFLFALFLAGTAHAEGQCPPNEAREVCVLEAQRNNALNDIASVAGQQDRSEKWWKAYVEGRDAQDKAKEEFWREWVDGELMKTARAAEAAKGRVR
jgi:hypothetical protein